MPLDRDHSKDRAQAEAISLTPGFSPVKARPAMVSRF
jgi:hypothetical protein